MQAVSGESRKIVAYFLMMAISNNIQPRINMSPPIGVIIPMPDTPTLFIAFKDASRYNEPENRTIPKTKKAPAQFTRLLEMRSDKMPTISRAKA